MKPNTPKWMYAKYDKRLKYTNKTVDENLLFEIAKCDVDSTIVLEAIRKINNEELLKKLLELPLNKERFGNLNAPALTCPFDNRYEKPRIAILNKITDLNYLQNLDRSLQTYSCMPYRMGFYEMEHWGTHIIEALDNRFEFLEMTIK